ncbi:MAG: protein kinase [Planctomycetaceae bacterium]|nr:protein kinase [Planctomycetaceae bacterium]
MIQKASWFVPITLYLAAISVDFVQTESGTAGMIFLGAAISGWLLPKRHFYAAVTVIGLTFLLPLAAHINDPWQWCYRLSGCVCMALLAFFRDQQSGFGFQWSALGHEETETTFGNTADSIDTHTQIGIDVDDLMEFSFHDVHHDHETAVSETHHRRKKEVAHFALDAGETRDYIEPALQRLYDTGKFTDAQMKMIANEMRILEDRGLVAGFASCLPSGTQIGRFVVEEPLGRGGEGYVYRGHDESGQPAAIKILHNMRVSDRFRREMHVVRQLAHPNIVTAYEVGEFRGLPFITMELLTGPDLYVRVRESGPLSWQEATNYILQASRALSHAHQRKLIHRDLKPGNMILSGGDVLKLVDFGLAAMADLEAENTDSVYRFQTEDGHLAGTLPFMAPEQARSLANANVQSDIYGLGATWYYLLTGQERLKGKTFSQQFENLLVHRQFHSLDKKCLPEDLYEIFRKTVSYDPSNRHASCDELSSEIEETLKKTGKLVDLDEINVLVIEDSKTDMLFTIEMLRRSNSSLNIHQANSLASGIEICKKLEIGLVLLDLTLPDSSGVETVERFRHLFPNLPLVVLTGMSKDEVSEQTLAAGADTFVSKQALTAHRMERTIFVTLSRHRHFRPDGGASFPQNSGSDTSA